MALKTHGVTTETVEHMLLGAGVLYKNLSYSAESGWSGTVLGATSGGIQFKYEINWLEVEVDGATVPVKGISRQKLGESATLSGEMTELSPALLVTAMHLCEESSTAEGYTRYVTAECVEEADYLSNVAFVGTLSGGGQLILILPNALCTEALELSTKNATQSTFRVSFLCTTEADAERLDRLPLELYFPTA